MKKFILLLVLFLSGVGVANAFIDSYTLSRNDLPEAAREMLDEYFPKAKIGMIKIDRHLLKKTDYDVRLVDGTTIEFTNKGKWTSVDCKKRALPDGLVPKTVVRHVTKNYPDTKITGIVKKTASYEITLSDGVRLKYNLLGQFKGVIGIEEDD